VALQFFALGCLQDEWKTSSIPNIEKISLTIETTTDTNLLFRNRELGKTGDACSGL
tara:strand:- start:1939 stop:2106 length:168 start_codon:yes stop_codon:yes gene_type:complete